jgi:hypothetical protein
VSVGTVTRPASTGRLSRLYEAIVGFEGSTRPVALLRIAFPLLVYAEYADQLLLLRDERLVVRAIGLMVLASATMMLVGWKSRLATAWTAFSLSTLFVGVGRYYDREYFTHHHSFLLLLSVWILALTPCGASYSIDRWRAVKRAAEEGKPAPAERGALWAQRLLCVNLSTVYLWAAYDKLTPGFLGGGRMENLFMRYYGTSDYPTFPGFHALCLLVAYGTVATEIALVFALWFRRTQRYAMLVGIAFHVGLYLTLPVATFSALVISLYLAYFDPDAVHRAIDALSGHGQPPPKRATSSDPEPAIAKDADAVA